MTGNWRIERELEEIEEKILVGGKTVSKKGKERGRVDNTSTNRWIGKGGIGRGEGVKSLLFLSFSSLILPFFLSSTPYFCHLSPNVHRLTETKMEMFVDFGDVFLSTDMPIVQRIVE